MQINFAKKSTLWKQKAQGLTQSHHGHEEHSGFAGSVDRKKVFCELGALNPEDCHVALDNLRSIASIDCALPVGRQAGSQFSCAC
jgi:hypothetical protein